MLPRSYSDSFVCVNAQKQGSNNRTLLSRIFTVLNLDRCFWPHGLLRLTCVHCLSSTEPRPRTMDSTDGRELDKPRSPRNLYQHRHLDPPKTILDVDYKLLQSGVAVLPGKEIFFPPLCKQAHTILYTANLN